MLGLFLALSACTTSTLPTPPRVELPSSVPGVERRADVLVTDFATRIDVPGASVLPPHGPFDGWVTNRSRVDESDFVMFRAPVPVGRTLVVHVASIRTSESDWRRIRSVDSAAFRGFVQA